MEKEKLRQAAEAASLSRIGSRILGGVRFLVKWLPKESKDLGYTSSGNPPTVNVAWNSKEFMSGLTEDEKTYFRMGVFAHELLHQCFTNFAYATRICEKEMSQYEAAIFMTFSNVLEDPAIEYFAPQKMGGKLLAALRYTIASIYKKSPPINESDSAFSQLINALINFGDVGMVKGNFTFPEAKKYFKIVAPLYNEGITCPDSKRRIDIARECMEITKPLWEDEVKNAEMWDKLKKELMDFLKKRGVPMVNEDELSSDEDSSKEAIRGLTLEKLKDDDDEVSEESDDEGDGEDDNKVESGKSKSEDSKDDAEEDAETKDGTDSSDAGEDEDTPDESDDSKINSESDDLPSDPSPVDKETPEKELENLADEILEEDLYISDEELEEIRRDIEREQKQVEKELAEDKKPEGALPSYDINSKYFKKVSCLNRRVVYSPTMSSLYKEIVVSAAWDIKVLTKALDAIFEADKEENVRSTSGSYNIKRGTIGCTARIMDKKKDPSNKKDACVLLLVDLSGSMRCGTRMEQARKSAIVLAESLRKLNIPYYVMGFTADRAAQAEHNHYVEWDGKGRESLASMQAGGNNFDGYSIRYASNILKSRPESRKFLFVISDGEPACDTYRSMSEGNADTMDAVREANKVCEVFGIAIGNSCDAALIQSFYGKNFIHCKNEALLVPTLAKKIVKQLK